MPTNTSVHSFIPVKKKKKKRTEKHIKLSFFFFFINYNILADFGNNEERNENEISQKLLGIDGNELATLYVEGLPCDVTKREVSHIFRHYKGFKDIRIIPKEDKTTKKTFILCFVDFETREDAGAAMKELQGYKMDLEYPEQRGLTIYFARTGKLFKH